MPKTLDLTHLHDLSLPELRREYARLFGDRCSSGNRPWIIRRLAWRLQAVAHGDLSLRARQRAAELAHDADLRTTPPRATAAVVTKPIAKHDRRLPPVGSVISRTYKGQTLQVLVLQDGFEWNGGRFASLSAVAKAISGQHTSGFLFFGLAGQEEQR